MDKKEIVTIKGQRYNAATGLPLAPGKVLAPVAKKSIPASGIHSAAQKSQTLVRRITKNPTAALANRLVRKPGQFMDIARSSKITRFASTPTNASVPTKTVPKTDIPATVHPMVKKVHQIQATAKVATAAPVQKTPREIKQEAIAAALAKPSVKTPKKSFIKRHHRILNIVSLCSLLLIIAAYFTYINIPNLSVQIAAKQAGINAAYPEYKPDGYSFNGPVRYNDGQVTINFRANTGKTAFSINQSKSSWDSSAVLDNIVRKKVSDKYITNQEHGLTIYTYDGNAAWVNAGILYTISGDAPLSSEQIRHIATSL